MARTAANRNETPRWLLRKILSGFRAESLSFVLPTHLNQIAKNLPSALGITPDWLLEHTTFFPALAPFLERGEGELLRQRLFEGERPFNYPICSSKRQGTATSTIRYCPQCARDDRSQIDSGLMTLRDARWRREHNLFGVSVCWLHGCRLITTDLHYAEAGKLPEADAAIPADPPDAIAGEAIDLTLAQDVAALFAPGCVRPGRLRIATALRGLAMGKGCAFNEQDLNSKMIERAIRDFWGDRWLTAQGIVFSSASTAWHREVTTANARVYPAIRYAIMARAFGLSLTQLLVDAARLEPQGSLRNNSLKPPRGLRSKTIEKRRAALLAFRKQHPDFTRSELYRAANHTMALLHKHDSEWLEAHLPPKITMEMSAGSRWEEMDSNATRDVILAAEKMRSSAGKPSRITNRLLRVAVGQRGRCAAMWRERLPQFHRALEEAVESDVEYARRRIFWLEEDYAKGRQATRGLSCYLQQAGLEVLAKNDAQIREMAVEAISSRNRCPN